MKPLTPWLFGCVRLEFKLADLWVGVYYSGLDYAPLDIWVCIIPCFPVHFRFMKENTHDL